MIPSGHRAKGGAPMLGARPGEPGPFGVHVDGLEDEDHASASAPADPTQREEDPMTETVNVRVLLLVGDQAEIVADVPPAERAEPERYPAADIAAATGLDVSQLPGRQLRADVGVDGRLSGWRLPE